MPSQSNAEKNATAGGEWTALALRLLASVKLTVVLLALLAAVLAAATLVERTEGPGYVQWYVYHSDWFTGLLAVLAANIVAAAVIRYPWKPRHTGFLIAHAGILVLMLGALLTRMGQIEGRLALTEGGEPADRIVLSDHRQLEVRWQDASGGQSRAPAAFVFKPGPVDWPDGKTFDLGEKSGVHLRVTKYLCRSRVVQDWIADDSPEGLPLLDVVVTGSETPGGRGRLIAGPFGGAEQIGPVQIEFYRLRTATMLDDFLKPPDLNAEGADPSGILSIHHNGEVQRIPVGPNVGKKIPVGDGKLAVELVEYLPNARPGPAKPGSVVNFVSEGTKPENPMLELRIHGEEGKEPLRQVAFANDPFRSFEGMHGRSFPVQFWYHHPAAAVEAGAQFAQTPDGKLYCRTGADGKYRPLGLVRAGDEIGLPGGVSVAVVQHLDSARPEYTFQPVPYAQDKRGELPPAVRLDVTAGGKTQEVWLRYDDQRHGVRRIETPEGPLGILFGDYTYPLNFSLRLTELKRTFDPGEMRDPVVASAIRLVDKSQELDEEREIGLNRPLEHGKFRFFQSGTAAAADGRPASILGVTADPGHNLKYLGSAMLCVGILCVFFRKAPFGRHAAKEES